MEEDGREKRVCDLEEVERGLEESGLREREGAVPRERGNVRETEGGLITLEGTEVEFWRGSDRGSEVKRGRPPELRIHWIHICDAFPWNMK